VASPLTIALKERESRWREIRTRLVNRGVDVRDTAWHGLRTAGTAGAATERPSPPRSEATSERESEPAATSTRSGDGAPSAPAPDAAAFTATGHPPRPRKKRR
jgi:hypothetical protein